MRSKFKIGAKYQIYEQYNDNDKTLYRLIKAKNENEAVFKKCGTNETFTKSYNDIVNSMVEIQPDAILHAMWTKYENRDDDFYIRVFRTEKLTPNDIDDALVLIMRQDTLSTAKNMFASDMSTVYVGECLTVNTLPSNDVKLTDLYEFDKIQTDMLIHLYIDDDLNDIMELFGDTTKIFDDVLRGLSKKNSEVVKGYAESLSEFLIENDFIDNFRYIYGIIPIDFPIILGKESYDSNGNIKLNTKQINRLQDILRKYISDVNVLEYDYDLDILSIVKYSHIMVSDLNDKVYLIAYIVTGDYPVDDDVAMAMNK